MHMKYLAITFMHEDYIYIHLCHAGLPDFLSSPSLLGWHGSSGSAGPGGP